MALKNAGGDAKAFIGQENMIFFIDDDQPVLAHLAQDDGYRRAGIGQIRTDVDRMNLILLLGKNVDGFQIIFNGFGYGHGITSVIFLLRQAGCPTSVAYLEKTNNRMKENSRPFFDTCQNMTFLCFFG